MLQAPLDSPVWELKRIEARRTDDDDDNDDDDYYDEEENLFVNRF